MKHRENYLQLARTSVSRTDCISICLIISLALILCSCSAAVSAVKQTMPIVDSSKQLSPDSLLQAGHSEFDIPGWSAKPAAKPPVSAASSVLMDAVTGQVMFQHNPHQRRPNASTTKIMTAILLLENCKLDDTVVASKKCSETLFTSIHLVPGEKISVQDMLASLMVRSANDAAVAVAEHVGGSVEGFAQLMNQKSIEIGCADTNFVTPNGLYDPKHYSSAYDLCLMARYAFNYPAFNQAIKTRKYVLDSRTKNREDLVLFSRAKFLKNYQGADGVKSGYVKQAGNCYVGSATRNGWRLVSTVLNSKNVSEDTATLMDYGYNAFKLVKLGQASRKLGSVQIRGGSLSAVSVYPASDIAVAVPKQGGRVALMLAFADARAPIEAGQIVGTATTLLDGEPMETIELRAMEPVQVSLLRKTMPILIGCGILCGMLLVKYGTTSSKNPGGCRLRVASLLRELNRRWQSFGQR